MDKLQVFALLLLTFRLIATAVLLSVLKKQLHYFRTTYTEAPRIRKGLFVLVIAATLTQIVPILIDIAALLELYQRGNVVPIGVAYAFSNATLSLVTAFGWRYLYGIMEEDQQKILDVKEHTEAVEKDNRRLSRENRRISKK